MKALSHLYNLENKNGGFTLVEIIVGLVIGSISISLVATLIFPLFTRSVEPMLQIRAAEYAQAILEDAMSKRYDEATPAGGFPPCATCTAIASFGFDAGESADRSTFDDVDDYNAFCNSPQTIQNVFGDQLDAADEYGNFEFGICVTYEGGFDGTPDISGTPNINAKLITVTVNPPSPAIPVTISAYRANY